MEELPIGYSLKPDLEYENLFWTQILGDHMMILMAALAPEEQKYIARANELKNEADELRESQTDDLETLEDFVERVRQFKHELLAKRLSNGVKLGLPPTFINHMINELEEYQKVLLQKPSDIFGQNKLWLRDAAGHADALISDLDSEETEKRKLLKKIKKHFMQLESKSKEIKGYYRSSSPVRLVQRLTAHSIKHIKEFVDQLEELSELMGQGVLLSRLSPLILDHMVREEAYYLYKMGEIDYRDRAIQDRVE